jgi:polygalacturonase
VSPGRVSATHLMFSLAAMALFAAIPASALDSASSCNPRDYGAKGNGVSKDTAAIQAAIDACESKSGGIVRLTAGTYLRNL